MKGRDAYILNYSPVRTSLRIDLRAFENESHGTAMSQTGGYRGTCLEGNSDAQLPVDLIALEN
jgi:hypothetical protein